MRGKTEENVVISIRVFVSTFKPFLVRPKTGTQSIFPGLHVLNSFLREISVPWNKSTEDTESRYYPLDTSIVVYESHHAIMHRHAIKI